MLERFLENAIRTSREMRFALATMAVMPARMDAGLVDPEEAERLALRAARDIGPSPRGNRDMADMTLASMLAGVKVWTALRDLEAARAPTPEIDDVDALAFRT